jgi:hypothetical protein
MYIDVACISLRLFIIFDDVVHKFNAFQSFLKFTPRAPIKTKEPPLINVYLAAFAKTASKNKRHKKQISSSIITLVRKCQRTSKKKDDDLERMRRRRSHHTSCCSCISSNSFLKEFNKCHYGFLQYEYCGTISLVEKREKVPPSLQVLSE